jgi:hypothetical protein
MRARDRSALRCLIAAVVLLKALYAGADECSQPNTNGVSSGDQLNISGIDSSTITTAIGYWSGGCPGYGTSFPNMTAGGSGGIAVSVIHYSGTSTLNTGSCGRTMFNLQAPGNTVTSATIEIWDRQGNGIDCNLSDTLAHELGHILGLTDNNTSACIGHIMGGRPSGGTRSVSSSDCTVYDGPSYGGNGDGVISEDDLIWSHLRLWVDRNHDGISQPQEISSLGRFGIVAIRLDFSRVQEVDGNGNLHLLQSTYLKRVTARGLGSRLVPYAIHDVFFKVGGD